VVLIKYFPELSRSYDKWTGKAFYSGVAFGKNSLGCLCLVSGLFFVWNLMTMWRRNDIGSRKKEVALDVLFVSMIWWLMGKAQSSTSWAAFCFGSFLLCALGVAFVKRSQGKFDLHVLVAIGAILMTSLFLDVQETVLGVLNRDVTLTGRTELWEELVGMVTDPVLGVGFHSFWLGERLKRLQEMYWWQPNEAHNGYLEIYLNLGAMGIVLFITLVIAAYRNCRKALVEGLESGRIRMVLLGVGLLYGVTEAAFRELSLMWFMFLLASVEWPAVVSSRGAAGSDSSMNNVWYKE
jgi:O-antigen ligase